MINQLQAALSNCKTTGEAIEAVEPWLTKARAQVAEHTANLNSDDVKSRAFIHEPCGKRFLLTHQTKAVVNDAGEIDLFCSVCKRNVINGELSPVEVTK
jgi:hypothetical protein